MSEREACTMTQWWERMNGLKKNLVLWVRESPRPFQIIGGAIGIYLIYQLGYAFGKAVYYFSHF